MARIWRRFLWGRVYGRPYLARAHVSNRCTRHRHHDPRPPPPHAGGPVSAPPAQGEPEEGDAFDTLMGVLRKRLSDMGEGTWEALRRPEDGDLAAQLQLRLGEEEGPTAVRGAGRARAYMLRVHAYMREND